MKLAFVAPRLADRIARRAPRGVALGTVLLCFLALVTILFAAATGSVSHLRVMQAVERQQHARNLAESAITTALSEMTESGTPPSSVVVSTSGVEGQGTLTFDPSVSPSAYSTYNLDGSNSVSGAQARVVPGNTVHLIGQGTVGSARSVVECLYYRPPFPDGLIASGPVKASALKLFAIRRDGAYEGGDPNSIRPEEELPGNLFSNFGQGWAPGQRTVEVSENSDISGSLGAVGTVLLDTTSVVRGELRPGSADRPIPNIDIAAKLADLKPNAIPYSSSDLDHNWFVYSSGSLNVVGDLALNGSALLVEGDLTISGAVVGTGVILVDGDVTIQDGGSDVTAGEQTAIACTGDFQLSAATPEGNYFKGLVYCEGDFVARDITVVGATVVNSQDNRSARGQAELENVRFVHNPGAVDMSLRRVKSEFYLRNPRSRIADNERHYAVSFLRVPHPGGKGYLVSSHVYFTNDHNGRPGGGALNPDRPMEWTPALSKDKAFPPVAMMLDSQMSAAQIQADPGFQSWIQEVAVWMKGRAGDPDGDPDSSVDHIRGEISGKVAEALRSNLSSAPDVYNVSFSLNNLLGELLSASRVLLWRSLEEQ